MPVDFSFSASLGFPDIHVLHTLLDAPHLVLSKCGMGNKKPHQSGEAWRLPVSTLSTKLKPKLANAKCEDRRPQCQRIFSGAERSLGSQLVGGLSKFGYVDGQAYIGGIVSALPPS